MVFLKILQIHWKTPSAFNLKKEIPVQTFSFEFFEFFKKIFFLEQIPVNASIVVFETNIPAQK